MHRTHTADKPAVSNNSGDPVLTCTIAPWSSPPKTSLLPSHQSDSVALSLSMLLPLSVPRSVSFYIALSLSQTLSGSSQTAVQQVLSVFTPAAAAAAVAFQQRDKHASDAAITTTVYFYNIM